MFGIAFFATVRCMRVIALWHFAVEYDVNFNTVKSVVTRIGIWFNVTCAPLMLDGMYST